MNDHTMASYNNDTMTFQFHSSLQDEDVKNDTDDGHNRNLSRLSVSTSSSVCCDDDGMAMYMSGLSIEGDDGDDEFSDGKEFLYSSDEKEMSRPYPLPATVPPRGNEVRNTKEKGPWRKRCRRMRKSENKDKENVMVVSDESRLRVITRPKGGRRSLCMDLEEVKACRDLGFEIPSPLSLSFSNSTLDTSSAVTSPICCISSPGDDPKDVKARLKMWAQAVAASASRYGT